MDITALAASPISENQPAGADAKYDKFILSEIPAGATLLGSYIGYLERKVQVEDGKSSYQITLHEDTQKLDEVIVIGYGVEKKINMTGAITNVKTEELSSISTTNLSNTLAGRAPGLTIVGHAGLAAAEGDIRPAFHR